MMSNIQVDLKNIDSSLTDQINECLFKLDLEDVTDVDFKDPETPKSKEADLMMDAGAFSIE
jgi:hypothetical protein